MDQGFDFFPRIYGVSTLGEVHAPSVISEMKDLNPKNVKGKNGPGSDTLSMLSSGARVVNSILEDAVGGKTGMAEYASVCSEIYPGVHLFPSDVRFQDLFHHHDKDMIRKAKTELKKDILKSFKWF